MTIDNGTDFTSGPYRTGDAPATHGIEDKVEISEGSRHIMTQLTGIPELEISLDTHDGEAPQVRFSIHLQIVGTEKVRDVILGLTIDGNPFFPSGQKGSIIRPDVTRMLEFDCILPRLDAGMHTFRAILCDHTRGPVPVVVVAGEMSTWRPRGGFVFEPLQIPESRSCTTCGEMGHAVLCEATRESYCWYHHRRHTEGCTACAEMWTGAVLSVDEHGRITPSNWHYRQQWIQQQIVAIAAGVPTANCGDALTEERKAATAAERLEQIGQLIDQYRKDKQTLL